MYEVHTFTENLYRLDLMRLRFRAYRKWKGQSQAEWAEMLRLHRPSFTLIEEGKQQLRPIQLMMLLDYVEGDARWWLGVDLFYEAGTIPEPGWWTWASDRAADEVKECDRLTKEYRDRGAPKKKAKVKA